MSTAGRTTRRPALAALIFCLLSSAAQAQTHTPDLNQLLSEKKYLELEQALQSNAHLLPSDREFFAGILANRRNRVAKSIHLLRPLIPGLAASNKERAIAALSTLADDYEKSFQYASAADTYARLDQEFGAYMTEGEHQRIKNEASRWNLLRHAPPQTTIVAGPFRIPTTRDAMGLLKITITIKERSLPVILDTGANLCTIRRSTARQLGLKLSAAQATSRGVTGAVMSVHTTVIPEIRFGGARLRNVAAMVIEDEDLDFSQLHYQLPGSLGFPVLSALGRISFFADGQFGVQPRPKRVRTEPRNLFLERLTPVVAAKIGRTPQLFTIDTGATGSFLTVQYYAEHRREFESQPLSDLDLKGAGGSQVIPVHLLPVAKVILGGGCVRLSNLPVLTQSRGIADDHFYGNFGQNVLRKLQSYTFDFRNMNFSVETPDCKEFGTAGSGELPGS